MNKFKNMALGVMVFLLNSSALLIQSFKPDACSGACGSCGFGCAVPAAGAAGIAAAVLLRKLPRKVYLRLKKSRIFSNNTKMPN